MAECVVEPGTGIRHHFVVLRGGNRGKYGLPDTMTLCQKEVIDWPLEDGEIGCDQCLLVREAWVMLEERDAQSGRPPNDPQLQQPVLALLSLPPRAGRIHLLRWPNG